MKAFTFLILLTFSSLVSSSQVTTFSIDNAKLNKPLSDSLEAIYKADQSTRMAYIQAKQQNKDAPIVDSLLKVMKKTDQENLAKVNAIIKHNGWLSPQKVGMNGAQAYF